MYKGKISAFVALGILGGLFYVGLQLTNAQSVSVTTAPASHLSCVPDKDYPNSNGYVESYTRPNKCHSKKVFYNYGTHFQMGDCGNAPWCYWRVRCPAGTTAQTHSSGGGWHIGMSPNINGAYDGPAHVFCADSSGNQYDPIPGESDANPNHSHAVYQTGYQSLAKAVVVDTNQTYFYSFKDSKWYDCPAGATGPHEQSNYRDIQNGSFPGHFHCINGQQNLTDSDTNNDNSEAPPVLLTTQPSWEVVGSGFSTQDDTTAVRDQFIDKSTNYGQTPLGSVRCLSTASDKVYFSTTGTCPTASQFPAKGCTSLALVLTDNNKTSYTGNEFVNYKYTCSPAGTSAQSVTVQVVKPDGTATTYVTGSNIDTASLGFSVSNLSAGNYTLRACLNSETCAAGSVYSVPFTVVAPPATATTTSGGTPAMVTVTALTQYGNNKYNLKVEDADGLKEFSIKKAGGASIYGGSPGTTGNTGACGGTNVFKSLDSGTVTLESTDFPLSASVVDCRAGATAYTFSVPALASPVVVTTTPSDPSLIGYWKFDGSGTNEVSGSPAAVIVGNAMFPASGGKLGGYAYIPGNGNYVKVPYNRMFDLPDSFTVEFWFRQRADRSFLQDLVYKGTGQNNYNFKIFRQLWDQNNFGPIITGYTAVGSGFWSQTSNQNQLTHSVWHHVVYTKDSQGSAYYLDGKLTHALDTTQYSEYAGSAKTPAVDIIIGDSAVDTDIDNLKIYNRGLSAAEAAQNGGFPPPSVTPPSNWVKHQWTFIDGSNESNILQRVDREYLDYIASVDAQCWKISKNKFTWKPGAGDDSAANWRNFGIPDCSAASTSTGTSTVPVPQICPAIAAPKCAPDETPVMDEKTGCYMGSGCIKTKKIACPMTSAMPACPAGQILQTRASPDGCSITVCVPPTLQRECKAGEMPGMGNNCMMPSYRWNIAGKKWEKCEMSAMGGGSGYSDVMNNPKATHTSCQSFFFDSEEEWRTQRFLVRPPEKYGEWYMPPWDAATRQLQYNPKTDQLEECRKENSPTTMMTPMQYYAPCMPTPAEDGKWILLKSRAEYKMHQVWSKQVPPVPGPGEPVLPDPDLPIIPLPEKPMPPLPVVPVAQCKAHLVALRNSINADKRFWKDTNRQLAEVAGTYAEADTVRKILDQSKGLILDIESLTKSGKCTPENLKDIQAKSNTLHQELFAEISGYLTDIHDAAEYGVCVRRLEDQTATLRTLLTKNLDDETKADVTALIGSVKSKQAELKEHRDDFEYDVNFECREFAASLESQVAPLRLSGDKELNRIVSDVVSEKFRPVIAELREQLAGKGKQLDELMVQIAELHKAVDTVSTAANQISEKITVSYTALAKIEEKFEKEKAEIQTAKERLIPLVEQAISLIKETSCVPRGEREPMVQEFGTVASVNWFGERANELERRLNVFIASCRANDVAATDIAAFHASIGDASSQNQRASYEAGLTPFPDVPTHVWYYSGMQTGYRNGFITQGRPSENVLRQDALLMVLRANGVGDEAIKGECAIPVSAGIGEVSPYARCAVTYALAHGLPLVSSMTVPVQRVEVAQWIAKLTALPSDGTADTLKNYTDVRGITGEQLDAVREVVASEVMVGQVGPSASTFQPYTPLTRSALAVMLEKLLGIR